MVILTLLLLPMLLFADIDVLLDREVYYENQPITGEVQITVPSKAKIDEESFKLNGKRLQVELKSSTPFDGPEAVTMYRFRFSLPKETKGLKAISPISVSVDGKRIASNAVAYEVKGIAPGTNVSSTASELKIEPIMEAPKNLYPGQKIVLGYRYLYKGAIDLDLEELPIIDKTPFKRLGEKIIEDKEEGDLSIRTITQNMQIEKPGDYSFPLSRVRGYSYITAPNGSKIYQQPALESQVAPFALKVLPFPEEGKPPFFNGAIGPFEITSQADLPPLLRVQDRFKFIVTLSGDGDVGTLKPLILACQPGFIGNFDFSDLPPEGEVKKGEKKFFYELKPVNSKITSIAPVFFAYFDPDKAQYQIIQSQEIPLKIEPYQEKTEKIAQANSLNPQAEFETLKEDRGVIPFVKPIPILSNKWILPFLFLALFLRYRKKKIDPASVWQKQALGAQDASAFAENALLYLDHRPSPKGDLLKKKIEALRYGKGNFSLKELKNDFAALFILFMMLTPCLQANFYQDETKLNQELENSLKNGEWTQAAHAFLGLNKPVEAEYYFEKALISSPWNEEIKAEINLIRKNLGLPEASFSFWPPVDWLITLLSLSLLLALIYRPILYFSAVFMVLTLLIHYLSPIEAIMIKGDSLRLEPYMDSPSVKTIRPGEKVEVLNQAEEGTFLKIKDNQGQIGFILFEKIRTL